VALVVAGEIGIAFTFRIVVMLADEKLIVQVPDVVVVNAPELKHFMFATAPAEL